MTCECDWPNRRWNPASGLCESCRGIIPTPEPVALWPEMKRLRAFEAAMKGWLFELDHNKEPQMLYEADVALRLRDILAGRGSGG